MTVFRVWSPLPFLCIDRVQVPRHKVQEVSRANMFDCFSPMVSFTVNDGCCPSKVYINDFFVEC